MIDMGKLLGVNPNAIMMPMLFTANNARFASHFPYGTDELWMADLIASRNSEQCGVFENVLFVETDGIAYIYGIEFEDGYPKGLMPDLALKQQSFIQFLRDETRRKNESLGALSLIFSGHEYSTEGRATAAYIAARDAALMMGVGYRNNDGKYEMIAIDPESE